MGGDNIGYNTMSTQTQVPELISKWEAKLAALKEKRAAFAAKGRTDKVEQLDSRIQKFENADKRAGKLENKRERFQSLPLFRLNKMVQNKRNKREQFAAEGNVAKVACIDACLAMIESIIDTKLAQGERIEAKPVQSDAEIIARVPGFPTGKLRGLLRKFEGDANETVAAAIRAQLAERESAEESTGADSCPTRFTLRLSTLPLGRLRMMLSKKTHIRTAVQTELAANPEDPKLQARSARLTSMVDAISSEIETRVARGEQETAAPAKKGWCGKGCGERFQAKIAAASSAQLQTMIARHAARLEEAHASTTSDEFGPDAAPVTGAIAAMRRAAVQSSRLELLKSELARRGASGEESSSPIERAEQPAKTERLRARLANSPTPRLEKQLARKIAVLQSGAGDLGDVRTARLSAFVAAARAELATRADADPQSAFEVATATATPSVKTADGEDGPAPKDKKREKELQAAVKARCKAEAKQARKAAKAEAKAAAKRAIALAREALRAAEAAAAQLSSGDTSSTTAATPATTDVESTTDDGSKRSKKDKKVKAAKKKKFFLGSIESTTADDTTGATTSDTGFSTPVPVILTVPAPFSIPAPAVPAPFSIPAPATMTDKAAAKDAAKAEKIAAKEAKLKEKADKVAAKEAKLAARAAKAEKVAAKEKAQAEKAEKIAAKEAKLKAKAEKEAAKEAKLKAKAEKEAAKEAKLKAQAEKQAAKQAAKEAAKLQKAEEKPAEGKKEAPAVDAKAAAQAEKHAAKLAAKEAAKREKIAAKAEKAAAKKASAVSEDSTSVATPVPLAAAWKKVKKQRANAHVSFSFEDTTTGDASDSSPITATSDATDGTTAYFSASTEGTAASAPAPVTPSTPSAPAIVALVVEKGKAAVSTAVSEAQRSKAELKAAARADAIRAKQLAREQAVAAKKALLETARAAKIAARQAFRDQAIAAKLVLKAVLPKKQQPAVEASPVPSAPPAAPAVVYPVIPTMALTPSAPDVTAELAALESMGFDNPEWNAAILAACGNNLARAISQLIGDREGAASP